MNNRNGLLLIADEVQTGFGRSGAMFASEWMDGGVHPDIIICAKGIANGFPISAIATRQELSNKQTPGITFPQLLCL
jgi:4-aminobutyrate aminotransferase